MYSTKADNLTATRVPGAQHLGGRVDSRPERPNNAQDSREVSGARQQRYQRTGRQRKGTELPLPETGQSESQKDS